MDAIALFRYLADLSPFEREEYFARSQIRGSLRAEVKSLLGVDRDAGGPRGGRVSSARETVVLADRRETYDEGTEVGPYELVRELGRGGMGDVWLAVRTDGALKRLVALKLLRTGRFDRQFLDRFGRERDILAGLTHPNIARLYDAGITASGQPYLVLEYIEGEPLTAYARARRLGFRASLRLFLQVLDAVHYAHRNLVVHRDLKPDNILVSSDNVVHLLDFGIAKLLTREQSAVLPTALTQQAGQLLTLEYASPEQIIGAALTTASDVYSLGVILYELLCGQRPHRLQRGSRGELEDAILTAEPLPPSRAIENRVRARACRGDLDTIVLKALKRSPAGRYSTVDAFSRDLVKFLAGKPVEARPDSQAYRLSKFVRRHLTGVGIAAAVTLAMLLNLAFSIGQMRDAREQRDIAVLEARRAAASLQLARFLVGTAPIRPGDRSVAERLAKSRELVRRQFAEEPAIRAELLFELADKVAELRDRSALGDVMNEIGALARESDLPWLQARYRCANAELKMNEGDSASAATLVREAFVHLAREDPPQFGATVECVINESRLAAMTGDFEKAAAHGRQATRLHERRGLIATDTYADAWRTLTTAYSLAGDVRGALDATRRQRETYERLGQDDTSAYLTTLFREATFLNRGGRRREALARSSGLLEQSKAHGVPDNQAQLAYHGIILLGNGRAAEALALFDAAARAYGAQKRALDEVEMHIWASDALVRLGSIRDARARLEPNWPAIEAQITAKNAAMANGLRVLANVLAAEGRLPEARAAIGRATTIVDAATSAIDTGATAIFLTSATLALPGGDSASALASVDRALQRATHDAIDPQASADVGEILLLRSRIHLRLGDLRAAEADRAAANAHLRDTLTPDHSLVRQASAFPPESLPASFRGKQPDLSAAKREVR